MPSMAKTALLVNNDLEILDAEAAILQSIGLGRCLQAEDGSEAWALFQSITVDLIICKYDIPEVNGMALLKTIRSQESFNLAPFILIAQNVTRKLVVRAGRAGVTDIIIWPYSTQIYQDKIRAILDVQEDPKFVQADKDFHRGMGYMNEARWDEALKSFEKVLKIHENPEVFYNMGYIKAAKGEMEEALKCFYRATQIDNQFALAHKKMGEVYLEMGMNASAEPHLQKAGDIFLERKQDAEAEEAFKVVLEINPETINVYNSLGVIYRRGGRYREAVTMYHKAIKVDSENENIYYNLSRAYVELKKTDSATDAVKKALEINPGFGPARELAKALELGLTLNL